MTTYSTLRSHAQITLRQMIFVLILSVVIGLSVNAIRSGGIPVIGDWSTEDRLSSNDGSSLVISIIEAKAAFDENRAVFLDARDKGLFEQGCIKGAKSLPWHSVDDHFIDIVEGIVNGTLIITYCDGETCDLSHKLALFLKEMGFSNVKILVNGWTVWQEMNFPVEGVFSEN